MIVGFNHNVTYRGVSFHVQTEDSGSQRPQLVTLLYHGGSIISSQKTVYADIIKVDNLDKVVEDLAKEQHKGMLRRLTKGEFDERIAEFGICLDASAVRPVPRLPATEATSDKQSTEPSLPEARPIIDPVPEPVTIVEEPIIDKFRQPKVSSEPSLDDLIYAYLTAGQQRK
jgi:hypothetical protein